MDSDPPFSPPSDPQQEAIRSLIAAKGGDPGSFAGELVSQLIGSALQLISDQHELWQVKLITKALKEMRYAYKVFNRYPDVRRISIFGSARTPPDSTDYLAAKALGMAMAQRGWMVITGGAQGIMKAGMEGHDPASSFGLSIRLPFEDTVNDHLRDDPKMIVFRYFFTRKLMFMSHADALAAFPGGVGTLDELFEALTLMQTGKGKIAPIVLVAGAEVDYWESWNRFMEQALFHYGMVSPWDRHFYYLAPSVADALAHIDRFYRRYHSSRYVGEQLVMRLSEPLPASRLAQLNEQFGDIIAAGALTQGDALPEEGAECAGMARLVFTHTRRDYGRLRALIDAVND